MCMMPARQDSLPSRHQTRLSGIDIHLKSKFIEQGVGGSLGELSRLGCHAPLAAGPSASTLA